MPNRLSKVRFSLIRNTTCLIGQRVGKTFASTTAAADGEVTTGDAAVGRGDDDGDVPAGSAPEHDVATMPATRSKQASEEMRMRTDVMGGRGYRGTS